MGSQPATEFDIDLTAEQLAAMGAISIQASRLDWQLLFIIEILANADYLTGLTVRALTEKSTTNQKRNFILTIYKDVGFLSDELGREIEALMKRVYRHVRKRNILAHSMAKMEATGYAQFSKSRSDPRSPDELENHVFSTEEMWQIVADFQRLLLDCVTLQERISGEMKSRRPSWL